MNALARLTGSASAIGHRRPQMIGQRPIHIVKKNIPDGVTVRGGVSGSGSPSSKSAATGGSITEDPETLRSDTLVYLIEAISEGPIWGLMAGASSIYIADTPIQNTDGTPNYVGVTWDQRVGDPDQAPINGPPQTSTLYTVDTQVKQATPLIRTIDDPEAAAVQITIQLPALLEANQNTGEVTGTAVSFNIERRAYGGAWETIFPVTINGKVSTTYNKQFIVAAPGDGQPWDIQVVRITADADPVESQYLQNQTWWYTYATLVMGSYTYNDTALINLNVDAFLFGNSLGNRAYHVRGLIISVPSNYDPINKTYSGIWDGTFVQAWTNNPAWIFYDLLTNSRYGLGEFVDTSLVDKFGLYTIGQYCDQLVPSGYFDQAGAPVLEPRFAFNGIINNRDDAYTVLQNIASAFRGMCYWSLGQVFATADMPADPVAAFSPANVIDGHFKYSGTAMKSRHSVAVVQWNDPNNYFRTTPEVVQNYNLIRQFGWRQADIQLTGCTSRGQANRFGKWLLDSEENQTETIEFTISWDGYVLEGNNALRPGQIIMVTDPRKNGNYRAGGRLAAINSTTSLVLDAPFVPETGQTYTISSLLPDGTFETHTIQSFSTDNLTVTLSDAFTTAPVQQADWIIQSQNMVARQYTVMGVQEDKDNTYKITALIFDPNKFARVEEGLAFDPIPYVRPTNNVTPVSNISISENQFFQNGVAHSRITLSWTGPSDFSISSYLISADTPHGFVNYPAVSMPTMDIDDAAAGNYTFYIVAQSFNGYTSVPTSATFTAQGWAAVNGPVPSALTTGQGDGTTFVGKAVTVTWTNTFPPAAIPFPVTNVVRVYDVNNTLLRTEKVQTAQYTYDYDKNMTDGGPRRSFIIDVTALDQVGNESTAASLTVSNPAPAKIVPTLKLDTGNITVGWPQEDTDYAGAIVWTSQNSGFATRIDPTSYAYNGPDTSTVLYVSGGTNYVWVGIYDAFGTAGMLISDPVSANVTDLATLLAETVPDLVSATGQVTAGDLTNATESIADQIAGILSQIVQDRDWNDQLHARSEQLLSVKSDGLSALIDSEQTARIEADYVMAQSIQVLQANVNGNVSAEIAQEATARATADSALAQQYTTLSTTVGANDATLTTVAASINGVEVQYGVIGTIDGVTGGFLFTGIQKLDGSVSYTMEIEGNVIVDGSISASKLNVTNLGAISANIGTCTAGIIQSSDGLSVWNLTTGTLIVSD